MSENLLEKILDMLLTLLDVSIGIFFTGIGLGIIYMLSWNCVFSYAFSLPQITFWQGVVLAIAIDTIVKTYKDDGMVIRFTSEDGDNIEM